MKKNKKKTKEHGNPSKRMDKEENKIEDYFDGTTEVTTDSSFSAEASGWGQTEERETQVERADDTVRRKDQIPEAQDDTHCREEFPLLPTGTEETGHKETLTSRLINSEGKILKEIIQLGLEVGGSLQAKCKIENIINELLHLKEVCFDAIQENSKLQGQVEGLREALATRHEEQDHRYRNAVLKETGKGKTEENQAREKPTQALLIESQNLKPDQVQKVLCRKVDPATLGLSNVHVRPNRSGVVVTSTSREGLLKLQEKIKTDPTFKDLTAKEPKKIRPEIKVTGIQEEIEDEEIIGKIIQQNNIEAEEDDFNLVKTWKGKAGKTACLRLSRKAFDTLKTRRTVSVGWTKCPIYDNTFVPRCMRCAQFGHTQANCSAKDRDVRCVRCAGRHYFRGCDNEERCVACVEEPYAEVEDVNHSFMARDCPQFLMRKKATLDQILVRLT